MREAEAGARKERTDEYIPRPEKRGFSEPQNKFQHSKCKHSRGSFHSSKSFNNLKFRKRKLFNRMSSSSLGATSYFIVVATRKLTSNQLFSTVAWNGGSVNLRLGSTVVCGTSPRSRPLGTCHTGSYPLPFLITPLLKPFKRPVLY